MESGYQANPIQSHPIPATEVSTTLRYPNRADRGMPKPTRLPGRNRSIPNLARPNRPERPARQPTGIGGRSELTSFYAGRMRGRPWPWASVRSDRRASCCCWEEHWWWRTGGEGGRGRSRERRVFICSAAAGLPLLFVGWEETAPFCKPCIKKNEIPFCKRFGWARSPPRRTFIVWAFRRWAEGHFYL